MKKIVILTGAGISAESGINTYRDTDGLWRQYDYMEVASSHAWEYNRKLCLELFNERRREAWLAEPNAGHLALKSLESGFDVQIITQNIDELHEKAKSEKIMHIHGSLHHARSLVDPSKTYYIKDQDICVGDKCELGSQLRPDTVLFGDPVPLFDEAIRLASQADIFIVVGTSLVVYPAASLVQYVAPNVPIYIVDPIKPEIELSSNVNYIQKTAVDGCPELVEKLLNQL